MAASHPLIKPIDLNNPNVLSLSYDCILQDNRNLVAARLDMSNKSNCIGKFIGLDAASLERTQNKFEQVREIWSHQAGSNNVKPYTIGEFLNALSRANAVDCLDILGLDDEQKLALQSSLFQHDRIVQGSRKFLQVFALLSNVMSFLLLLYTIFLEGVMQSESLFSYEDDNGNTFRFGVISYTISSSDQGEPDIHHYIDVKCTFNKQIIEGEKNTPIQNCAQFNTFRLMLLIAWFFCSICLVMLLCWCRKVCKLGAQNYTHMWVCFFLTCCALSFVSIVFSFPPFTLLFPMWNYGMAFKFIIATCCLQFCSWICVILYHYCFAT